MHSTPMNPPFDQKDLLWRSQFLSEATKRSSTMLQQARAAATMSNGANDYRDPLLSISHPYHGGALRQAPPGIINGSILSSDPNQASMVRLMMLRNQAQDALKMQNEVARIQPTQNSPIAPPQQALGSNFYPPFIDMTPRKPYSSMSAGGYLVKPFAQSKLPPDPGAMSQIDELLKLQRQELMSCNRQHLPNFENLTAVPRSEVLPEIGGNVTQPEGLRPQELTTRPRVYSLSDSSTRSVENPVEKGPAKKTKAAKKEAKKDPNKKNGKWLASLAQLKEYKEEFGDCIVPRGYPPNPRLASWVAEQRKQYKLHKDGKQSSITPERIKLLDEIDFAWNAQDAAWERHLEDLKKFRAEYGDCLVPLGNEAYPKLGLWIKEQRRHYTLLKQGKKSHMTEERALKLDRIGFCWDTHEQIWRDRLRELCEYRAVHGHCLVPTHYPANRQLGTWTHHQRRQYKKFTQGKQCHITIDRIRALESIGFVWEPRTKQDDLSASEGEESDGGDSSSYSSFDRRPSKRQKTV